MLQFMAFCFCLGFVLLMSGFAGAAIAIGLVFFATPVVYILWHFVLFPQKWPHQQ